MRNLIISMVFLALLVGCQTMPERSNKDREELLSSLINLTSVACKHEQPSKTEQKLLELFGTTAEEVCDCIANATFEAMSNKKLDKLINDTAEFGSDYVDREPWKTHFMTVRLKCLPTNRTKAKSS